MLSGNSAHAHSQRDAWKANATSGRRHKREATDLSPPRGFYPLSSGNSLHGMLVTLYLANRFPQSSPCDQLQHHTRLGKHQRWRYQCSRGTCGVHKPLVLCGGSSLWRREAGYNRRSKPLPRDPLSPLFCQSSFQEDFHPLEGSCLPGGMWLRLDVGPLMQIKTHWISLMPKAWHRPRN